jgi:hypothetical protein
VFSSRNWFEGSQVSKARPGAPFDFTFGTAEGTCLVISLPPRLSESAAPRDDKGEGGASIGDQSRGTLHFLLGRGCHPFEPCFSDSGRLTKETKLLEQEVRR